MFGFQAAGAAPIVLGAPGAAPDDHRHRHPDRQPRVLGRAPIGARDESGGLIDAVTDEQILEAYRLLARTEGVFVEPASAASRGRAAADRGRRPAVPAGSTVVCTLTGNGLKDPDWAISCTEPVPCRSTAEAVAVASRAGLTMAGTGARQPRAVHVRVPATSANLGPGFDTFGLALDRLRRGQRARRRRTGLLVEVAGDGADEVPATTSIWSSGRCATAFAGSAVSRAGTGPGLRATAFRTARGLGSSAAAIVAGLLLAARAGRRRRRVPAARRRGARPGDRDGGPPRQRCPRLFGGFTHAPGRRRPAPGAVRVDVHPAIVPVVVVPAHRALDRSHPRVAAGDRCRTPTPTFNAARAALLVHALTGRPAPAAGGHRRPAAPGLPGAGHAASRAQLVAELRGQGIAGGDLRRRAVGAGAGRDRVEVGA